MKRLMPVSVSAIETTSKGYLVNEIWIGDVFHAKISFEDYVRQFPSMEIALEHVARLNWGGSFDTGMLDHAVQQLILQLNTGEIAGIITTPDQLEALCEFLDDFGILSDESKILEKYIIAPEVAKRLT